METELRNMVMAFRVTELQTLLAYAGKNKTGRKNELQARALEMVKSKPQHVVQKIRSLYSSIQVSNFNQISLTGGTGYQNINVNPYSSSSSIDKLLQGRNPFGNVFAGNNSKIPNLTPISLPICPDVRLKRLPFYDIQNELIKPTSLITHGSSRIQESGFSFCLTPREASDIASSKEFTMSYFGENKVQYTTQVQLRFCLLETACDQDDQFPPSMLVKVNGKQVPLPHPIPSNRPGVEPKRPSRPLNVTSLVKLSPTCTNSITVTWSTDNCRNFALALFLVNKLTSQDLLGRVKGKGIRPSEFTRGMIKEIVSKDDGDCQIAMTSLKVAIACPLGKSRMNLPCRASTCTHLQCFDASLYLQMNEKKPTWNCPVCDKSILFENLTIDGYFQDVLDKMLGKSGTDIEVYPDGTWKPISNKKDDAPPSKKQKFENLNNTICLDDVLILDGDGDEDIKPLSINKKSENSSTSKSTNSSKEKKNVECVDLTLSDSDDDEEDQIIFPQKKRRTVIDDDSSSSSSTNDGGPQQNNVPVSPALITIDSRSSSPVFPQERDGDHSNDLTVFSNFPTNNTGSISFSTSNTTSSHTATTSTSSWNAFSGLNHNRTISRDSNNFTPPNYNQNPSSSSTSILGLPPPNFNFNPNYIGYQNQQPPPAPRNSSWESYANADFGSLDFGIDFYNQSTYSPGSSGNLWN